MRLQVREGSMRQKVAEHQKQEAQQQEFEAKRINDANQAAILRLMNELQSVAEGDLTQEATVTEDITGAIADSVNYAIDELPGYSVFVKDEAAANAALARVKAGEDYGKVSQEVTVDPTTAEAKGVIPCGDPATLAGQIDSGLSTALVGDLLGPTELLSAGGWVVSTITKREATPLAQVKTQLEQQIQAAKLPDLYEAQLKHVTVDPRYGTWDKAKVAVSGTSGSLSAAAPASNG